MSATGSAPATCTVDEFFVALLAATIADGEMVIHGFGSPCAQVAMHLARRTTAPSMVLVEGATYALNPTPAFIPPTGNDWALYEGARFTLRFEEFFDLACRGEVDRMFLSGVQIDPYGNTNVTAVGPLERPTVKLGGGGGGCNFASRIRHITLWTTRHRRGRTLVADCDFVTDVGHRPRGGTRQELGFTGSGPEWLVTELGVFDYDDEGHARLRRTFPDVTLDEIAAATGFELRVAPDLGVAPAPTPAQVGLIRAIDPLGVRRREFGPAELERSFPTAEAPERAAPTPR